MWIDFHSMLLEKGCFSSSYDRLDHLWYWCIIPLFFMFHHLLVTFESRWSARWNANAHIVLAFLARPFTYFLWNQRKSGHVTGDTERKSYVGKIMVRISLTLGFLSSEDFYISSKTAILPRPHPCVPSFPQTFSVLLGLFQKQLERFNGTIWTHIFLSLVCIWKTLSFPVVSTLELEESSLKLWR